MPLLYRLGFHKWRNYSNKIEVFGQEPSLGVGRYKYLYPRSFRRHSKIVCERHWCKRCGVKLRRKLVTNPDGTLSAVGWELDTGSAAKESA